MSRSLTVAVWLAAGCAGCGQGDLGATAPMEPMTSHDGGGAPMPVDHDGGTTPVMMMMDPCPRVRVTIHGDTLNLRSGPTLDSRILTTLDEGTIVTVVGVEHGDDVDGEDRWYEIDTHENRGYVTAYFVTCTSEPETFGPFDGFRLPLACGMSARISQGNNTTFSHQGLSAWAFDFSLALGTPLHALADGVVIYVKSNTDPGDPCYDGGGPECITEANVVLLRHADGTVTGYAHLQEAMVADGDSVRAGTPVGRSGSSGYSTGPHAHVVRQENCGYSGCQSIPMAFEDVPGDGVPETGDTVTSGNCPSGE